MPFVVCVMAVLVLCKPGPPLPPAKGLVFAVIFAALVAAGVLMVPVLEHYALTGMLLTGALLYGVFFMGLASANPLTIVLVIVICADPGRRCRRAGARGHAEHDARRWHSHRGLVSSASHALFPDPPARAPIAAASAPSVTRSPAGLPCGQR